ncbi:putative disease resistance protein RGA3 [Phoenix dactylifera]|uniref:Disease resistance protein RGA3 n=1 Tax=Phoenix dactylifera TaxID=42345 RepID=A0A8B8ZSR8_PHODC|nr:putative disease resistance protein RGA3 [Phoenix dactylifera]
MALNLDAFVSSFCKMLLTSAKEEVVKILGVPNEIKKLHKWLEMIQDVLADAENRCLEDNQPINRWLNELRDLMYDADDIIDECRIEGEKLLSPNSSISRRAESVRCCYPPIACLHKVRFRHEIGKRIKDLNRELEQLAKRKDNLHLIPAPRDDRYKSRISRKTSPIVEPNLVGEKIKDDTRRLADLLIKKDDEKIQVFAIVGMGGIGKTTLAQKIYNDEKLRNNFNQMPQIWLCVSQDFSESNLLRSIIKQAGGDPGEAKEKEVLEPMLSQVITNKKFFLILDDVWDAQVWDELLRKPLQSGLANSRILITSRHEAIARQMRAVYIHKVEQLSQKDGWSLICRMVFKECEEGDMHVLSGVGMRIVEKCDGLPLALRTVGGVLRTKEKRHSEWEKVLSSPAWSLQNFQKRRWAHCT